MQVHKLDPQAFLDYVHDIDLVAGDARRPSWRPRSRRCPAAG